IILALVFSVASPGIAANNGSKTGTNEKETISFPIYSIETGEEVGGETHKISTRTKVFNGFKEVTVNTDIINEDFTTGKIEKSENKSTMLFKGEILLEVDGEKAPAEEQEEIIAEISQEELDAMKPFADKFNAGEISADEYLEE